MIDGIPPFVPTDEWQVLAPGQAIPPGNVYVLCMCYVYVYVCQCSVVFCMSLSTLFC
jgi:hypothetical protein